MPRRKTKVVRKRNRITVVFSDEAMQLVLEECERKGKREARTPTYNEVLNQLVLKHLRHHHEEGAE